MEFQVNLQTESVGSCHPAEALCLAPTTSVAEGMRLMKAQNRGAVLVCHDRKVVGIFTERDALKMMAAGASFEQPLENVMTARPMVLQANEAVGKAIALMAHGGYRRLPIVDEQGCPTGILNVEAILHFLVEHFPAVIYNLPPEPHYSTQQREGA